MFIVWTGTRNFTEGRRGRKVAAVVNHITAGLMPGCLAWLQNPASKASAHYLITLKGEILQLVKDEDTAWHAGIVNKPAWKLYDCTNPNYYTIGIEHEGFDGGLTENQYQATLWLHRQLLNRHGLPADSDHVIGHCHIDSVSRKNCPGPKFPWERLFNDLRGGSTGVPEIPDWKVKAVLEAEDVGLISRGMHKGNEPADKGFVLSVVLNAMKKLSEKK